MRYQLLPITPARTGRTGRRSPAGRIVAVCAFALISILPASAQNAWRLLDFGLRSGFQNEFEWGTSGATLYFIDSLRGFYYPENERTPSSHGYYSTVDGGATWRSMSAPMPVPQTFLGGGFAYSSSGFISTDNGTTWRRMMPFTTPGFNYQATSLTAATPRHLLVLSQPHDLDTSTGELRPAGPNRLSFSRDGGSTWITTDSMVVEQIAGTGDRKLELYDSTAFGRFPAPPEMTDTFAVGWWQIYYMPDTNTALVSSVAFGRVNGQYENHYYLGHLNLKTLTATWQKLPFYDEVSTASIMPPGIQFINDQVAFAIQSRTTPTATTLTLWRSSNRGASWTSTALPDWVEIGTLRFVSPTLGVAVNAITTDAGVTWKEWAHPFEGGLFYPSDSSHYFVANRFSLFARSSDAGHTWKRNPSGALPRAIAGYGGHVVVGRSYQSILSSSDRGLTWRDAGLVGSVPTGMSTVWALGIPDTVDAPDRVLGVASIITYDADTSLVVIESTDGGVNWAVRTTLQGIQAPGGPVLMLFLEASETSIHGYIATGRRLYASTDAGSTWAVRDSTLYYQALELSDALKGVQVNSQGIYATVNSGATWGKTAALPTARNRALGLQSLSRTDVRTLFPDRTKANLEWTIARSTDAGSTWATEDRTGAPRPLDGAAYWVTTDSLVAIGRGATIQVSTDAARTFVLVKDTTDEFRALGGWIATGADDINIYVSGAGNSIGAFTVKQPPAAVRTGEAFDGSVAILGNPVTGSTLAFEVRSARASRIELTLIDPLGRVVANRRIDGAEPGSHRFTLDVDGLSSGHYTLRVMQGMAGTSLPVVIVH